MRRGLACAAVWAVLAPPSGLCAADAGVGAAATAGTGGYRRASVFADASLTGGRVEPYAWGETAFSRDLREFALGAGAWEDWSKDARGKAGVGLASGRYDDGASVSSWLFDLGAEADAGAATMGAGWCLVYGTLFSSRDAPAVERAANVRARGRPGAAREGDDFLAHELSGYGRVPVEAGVLGLRLGLDLPPESRAILSETASLRIPAGERLSLTPALTFEQGGANAAYVSLTAYCRF